MKCMHQRIVHNEIYRMHLENRLGEFHFMATLTVYSIHESVSCDSLTENKRTESKMILELLMCTSINTSLEGFNQFANS